jgi:hypothetical protein
VALSWGFLFHHPEQGEYLDQRTADDEEPAGKVRWLHTTRKPDTAHNSDAQSDHESASQEHRAADDGLYHPATTVTRDSPKANDSFAFARISSRRPVLDLRYEEDAAGGGPMDPV